MLLVPAARRKVVAKRLIDELSTTMDFHILMALKRELPAAAAQLYADPDRLDSFFQLVWRARIHAWAPVSVSPVARRPTTGDAVTD